MKHLLVLSLCLAMALLCGCASITYEKYEAKRDMVYEGQGGTKTTVDGVDFWTTGTPPRRYQVLGIMRDSRMQNVFTMGSRMGDIAAEIKKVGGNAAIVLYDEKEYIGTSVSGSSYGSATTNSSGNISGTTNYTPYGSQSNYGYNGTSQTDAWQTSSGQSTPNYQRNSAGVVIKYLD